MQLLSEIMGYLLYLMKTRGSSDSTVSAYGMDDRGSIPNRGRGYFF
jgi:hypothetical protein